MGAIRAASCCGFALAMRQWQRSSRTSIFILHATRPPDYGCAALNTVAPTHDPGIMDNTPLPPNDINALVEGLNRLACNLWGTWDVDTLEIFQHLSPRAWQNLYHNGVAVLHEVSEQELKARLQDKHFADRVRRTIVRFDEYLAARETWGREHAPQLLQNPVAYF